MVREYCKMKKLCLIRHAKSSWDDLSILDFDRSLAKRGYKDAKIMGKVLKNKNIFPDLILSSSAKRAKETVKTILKEIDISENKIIFDDRLYDSNISNYFYTIYEKVSNNVETLFLVAHNPTITQFANIIDPTFQEVFKTTSIAYIHLNIDDWQKLSNNSGKVIFHIYPQMFKD